MPTATTSNELLRDLSIGHLIGLQRLSNATVLEVLRLLISADADILAQINRLGDGATEWRMRRWRAIREEIQQITQDIYAAMSDQLHTRLREIGVYEGDYVVSSIRRALGGAVTAAIGITRPTARLLEAIVDSDPMHGRLLGDWINRISVAQVSSIDEAVRQGVLQGQTNDEIARVIRGTRANKYRDGILAYRKREAEAVTRTAVSHVTQTARDRTYQDNGKVVKAVQWLSTLDLRTTKEYCVPRDGKQYTLETHEPIGHGYSWGGGPGRIHWRCRSTSTAVLRSWRELGFDLDELPKGTRRSMDGKVARDTTYSEWLGRQSQERIEDVLGKERAKLFKSGQVSSVAGFYNEQGRLLTLAELRSRDVAEMGTAASEAAGFRRQIGIWSHEDELAVWNREVGVDPTEYMTEVFRGTGVEPRTDVRIEVNDDGNPVFWTELASTETGEKVGYIERYFRRGADGALEAYHAKLLLDEAWQGGGIGRRLIDNQVRIYDRIGLRRVVMHANLDVGGYAWARYGWIPETQEAWNALRPKLVEKIRAVYHSGALDVPDEALERMIALVNNDNPEALLDFATVSYRTASGEVVKVGKEVLLGMEWDGILDLTGPYREVFDAYVSR